MANEHDEDLDAYAEVSGSHVLNVYIQDIR